MAERPRILITFREGGRNDGPFVSHTRMIESALRERYDFIPLAVPRARVLLGPTGMARFVRRIKHARPDIVQFTGLQLEGFLTACGIGLAGARRSVVAVHGSSSEAIFFPAHKKALVHLLEVVTLRRTSACFGVSDYVVSWPIVKRWARRCYGRIYNLPGEIDDRSGRSEIRAELGIPDDALVMISTGRIVREKGFDVLASAVEMLQPADNVWLIVVGEGDYLDTLRVSLSAGLLGSRALCVGYRDDISRLLSASDMFVLLTLHETLGMSIIEAAAHGLPVVACRVGGVPEVIDDGVGGFLVEPGNAPAAANALGQLLANPDLRAKMGEHARAGVVSRFDAEEVVRQLDEVYSGLLSDD